jgi:hypothetical protein
MITDFVPVSLLHVPAVAYRRTLLAASCFRCPPQTGVCGRDMTSAYGLARIAAMFPLSPIAERDARGKEIFEHSLAESGRTEAEFFAALETPRGHQ